MLVDNKMISISLIFYIIFLIVTVILHYAIYTWTNDLNKVGCKCSDNTTRDVLNKMALILLLLIPYKIVHYADKYFTSFFTNFIGIFSLIYYCLIIYYIDKLNKDACECSENWKKDYSLITTIIFLCLIAFSLTLKVILVYHLNK
jgi:hypothetical protein